MRLHISQAALSRRAKVSRWKINTFELGRGTLSPKEIERITRAFEDEFREMQVPQLA